MPEGPAYRSKALLIEAGCSWADFAVPDDSALTAVLPVGSIPAAIVEKWLNYANELFKFEVELYEGMFVFVGMIGGKLFKETHLYVL